MIAQKLGVIGRRVRVVQDTGILDLHAGHGGSAAGNRPLQSAVAGVTHQRVHKARRDEQRVPGPALTNRTGKLRVRLHELCHRKRGEKRDIHRCEEDAVALVLEVGKADLGRVKHLGARVILIAQKDQAEV